MTPMPPHVMAIQVAYADLMYEVSRAIEGLDITPAAALMIAFIGDQEVKAKDIRTRDYYIGSNTSYNLKNLENYGYIKKQKKGRDGREKYVSLTPQGLTLAETIREALAERRAVQEMAA